MNRIDKLVKDKKELELKKENLQKKCTKEILLENTK
jgi:hypothetical protein